MTTTEDTRKRITITHTWEDGTLLTGSSKGDGIFELLRNNYSEFRYMRSIRLFGIYRSHDDEANEYAINRCKALLEGTGRFVVDVQIDNTQTRSFADAEQERYDNAAGRAERYSELADNASGRSTAAHRAAHRALDGIEPGQPILRGHHSERGHRRAIGRSDAAMRRSIDEQDKAAYHAGRAAAAEHFEEFRRNPGRTLRRIKGLEADLRGFDRNHPSGQDSPRRARIVEQIEYWQGVIKEAEAKGFKVWGPDDFEKGDYFLSRGQWWKVLRVNKVSLTGPHLFNQRHIVEKDTSRMGTFKYTFDEIKGRKSPEEMTAYREELAAKAAEKAAQGSDAAA
ncbi:DUF3560 domain-containing protein [Kitasatospora sp. NPDC056076]|uniref:DUF3560 domain-containing protein n=1 Tax=Kitasatospora sp. NPDC056076 TaxID=3345703 RepID=UPI0035D99321